jgi:ATP-dependent DNA ligase
MTLPIEPPIVPMLAEGEDEVPAGEGWLYEPKWDGFRAIVFKDGDSLKITSRKTQPLDRYFPELCAALGPTLPDRCVLDGEIIIPGEKGLDFDALLQRIHPAASRVNKLAAETPASYVAFDLLALGDEDLRASPFHVRRQKLSQAVRYDDRVMLTPQTASAEVARRWFEQFEGAGLDGVIAKRVDQAYLPGERVMVKVKHERTADCIVGGYRMLESGAGVGSLLLGLYDGQGVLHHVGHTSSFKAKEKKELVELLKPYVGGTSFGTGRTPGAPSRWNQSKDLSWTPLRPELVCEVKFDQLQGQRFRHAATFRRWRPDKPPQECVYAQVEPPHPFELRDILRENEGR